MRRWIVINPNALRGQRYLAAGDRGYRWTSRRVDAARLAEPIALSLTNRFPGAQMEEVEGEEATDA